MKNMNQGDLFNLIVDLNFAKPVVIARTICKLSDLELSEDQLQSNISRARKNGTGKPFDGIIGNIPQEQFVNNFFSIIFKDCDSSTGSHSIIISSNFNKIKNYLDAKELTFPGMEELLLTSSCEDFIKKMVLEAFQNHKPHTNDEHTQKTKAIPFSNENLSYMQNPTLHSQTIFCPSKFFNRADILAQMNTMLSNYKLVILSGIGGIGKTYLSREYAFQHKNDYQYTQVVTFDKSLKSIKHAILSLEFDNLNETEMNDDDRLEKRLDLLNQMKENTLLIIDNIDDTPSDLDYFDNLRTNSGIHIIITTRLTDCFSPDQTINVLPMSYNDQLEFFKSHYPDKLNEDDIKVINNILKCIDGHTLLIELVAKTMYAGALTPEQMLAYLKGNEPTELMPISISKDALSNEKRTMTDFIKLLFDVGYLDDDAKEALLYLSLLPIEGVGRKFFYNLMPKFRQKFNELISNSWLIEEKQNQILRLHPVIKDMLLKELKPNIKNCNSVLTNIHSHLQTLGNKLSDTDKKYICQILLAISKIENFYTECSDVTMICYFAEFCFNEYAFELSLSLYQTAAKISLNSPIQTVTSIYLNIGDVYKRLALYDDAIQSYLDALQNNKKQQNEIERSLQDAELYERLSDIYRKNSQYDEAMNYNDKAIAIYENSKSNADKLELAEIYNRRGIIFLNKASSKETAISERTSLLDQALGYYKKGLEIRENSHDSDRQLAYSYHNVGTAYNKLGLYKLAKENHEKALELRNNCTDTPMTDIASSHVWIGNDYMELGKEFMDIAKEHFEQSLKIRETILGPTHPEVAWSLMSLCNWYEKMEDYKTAITYAERAYSIRIAKFSRNHNYVTQTTDKISHLKQLLG